VSALGDALSDTAQIEELRRSLLSTQRQLAKARAKTDALADVTIQSAREAIMTHWAPTKVTRPAGDKRTKRRPEVAIWGLADWQGAKVTTTYNSQVMRERVMLFAEKAARITEIQRADHPVRECVVVFGGDMVEGLFNFPTQPFEIDATIFEQYVRVSSLIVDVVPKPRWPPTRRSPSSPSGATTAASAPAVTPYPATTTSTACASSSPAS
jgi:hypothetical protein